MILRRCDKCGQDFCPSTDYTPIPIPQELYEGRSDFRDLKKQLLGVKTRDMDLCGDCIKSLVEAITVWLNA